MDEAYHDAAMLRVVLDRLSTHTLESLYKAFEPAGALRISDAGRVGINRAPKPGPSL